MNFCEARADPENGYREREATGMLIQETYQTMTDQLNFFGFTLVDHIPSEHHAIAIFVQSSISFSLVGYTLMQTFAYRNGYNHG